MNKKLNILLHPFLLGTICTIAAMIVILMLYDDNHAALCREATTPRTLPDGGVVYPPTPEECR